MRSDPYRTMLHALMLVLPLAACTDGTDSKSTTTDDPELFDGGGCVAVPEDTETCPLSAEVDMASLMGGCGSEILSIEGEGTLGPDGFFEGGDTNQEWCCYPVLETEPTCVYGRPYLEEDTSLLAEVVCSSDWSDDASRPDTRHLHPEARAALREAWTEAALDEHAAVAAFSRVALELLQLGAPPHLLQATTQAALDEVRHAQMGFRLASAYTGEPVGPGSFPLGGQVQLHATLTHLAVAAAREGCIGETLTTLVAAEALRGTTDPAVRSVLSRIISDEEQHAALAWRTVAWAIARGGDEVRTAVASVFDQLQQHGMPHPARHATGPHAEALIAHGVPSESAVARALERGIAEVVLPASRALLGRGAEVCAAA